MMRLLVPLLLFLPLDLSGQPTVITWAYGPFGTPGDVAFVVEDDRIYQACGAYGSRGPCLYVIEENEVYHAADAFGRKGTCAFILDGDKLVRAQGTRCTKGSCALLLENEKVFRGDGPFCTKQEGAFYLERGEGPAPMTVYLAEGAFAAKSEALLEVKGPLPTIALLTILAGY